MEPVPVVPNEMSWGWNQVWNVMCVELLPIELLILRQFFCTFSSGAVLQTPLWPTVPLAEGIMEVEVAEDL